MMRAHLKFVIAGESYMEIVLVLVFLSRELVSNIERDFCRYNVIVGF